MGGGVQQEKMWCWGPLKTAWVIVAYLLCFLGAMGGKPPLPQALATTGGAVETTNQNIVTDPSRYVVCLGHLVL